MDKKILLYVTKIHDSNLFSYSFPKASEEIKQEKEILYDYLNHHNGYIYTSDKLYKYQIYPKHHKRNALFILISYSKKETERSIKNLRKSTYLYDLKKIDNFFSLLGDEFLNKNICEEKIEDLGTKKGDKNDSEEILNILKTSYIKNFVDDNSNDKSEQSSNKVEIEMQNLENKDGLDKSIFKPLNENKEDINTSNYSFETLNISRKTYQNDGRNNYNISDTLMISNINWWKKTKCLCLASFILVSIGIYIAVPVFVNKYSQEYFSVNK